MFVCARFAKVRFFHQRQWIELNQKSLFHNFPSPLRLPPADDDSPEVRTNYFSIKDIFSYHRVHILSWENYNVMLCSRQTQESFFLLLRRVSFFHPLGAEWEKRQIYSFNVSVWPIHNPTYHHHQHRCRHIGWVLGILFGTVIKRLTFFTILDDTSPAVLFRFFSLRGELQQP